ncbi:response regulator [Butyrivibrio sp. YAB3001]|uniref:response regulator n=1 Tax=Butyrivibrio sp. YAB3001 TaxID=1520812 RepID=UPI0008F675A7|nr:response regulator [Butyrivibrio sp. YAB3001]SFC19495.1 Hpt domain-containing protein [Butyrivibrio sp. YAB3001]
MDKKTVTDVAESRKIVNKVIIPLSFVLWGLLTHLCVFFALNGSKLNYSSNGTVYVTFFIFPFLVLGALYGYYVSMISFVIAFVIVLITDMQSSYNMAIFMVAALSFSLFSQYSFFMTKKKTFIAAIAALILTSAIEYLCFTVIRKNEYNLSEVFDYVHYFTRDALIVFGTAALIYLFMTKAPDIVKTIFPLGAVYTKAFQENKEYQRNIRKTRLSMKITLIIVGVELVLGIAVGLFMMVLFPDIRNMFVNGIERRENIEARMRQEEGSDAILTGDTTENQEGIEAVDSENSGTATDEMVAEINNIEFRWDEAAIGFDFKMILLMLCVGVPMAAFANFFTKVYIGGPIGRMSDFMYEFANAGDDKKLETGRKIDKMTVKTNDEIQVLHQSMVTTVHSIEEYINRIKEEQELEKELEVAQKASEAKSSFLSNMSHEIRTPINAVLGMNEMILREATDEQILEYANNVKSAGNSLLGIINDILDFSKIEAGKMDILPVEYHIGSTINDLINMVASKAEEKGLKLEVNVDENLPIKLIGDEIRIKQCVTNVLSNAVKYTETGTVTLDITYRKEDDESAYIRYRVVDTGIGIKEEDLKKLYSPFERIEEIRNRSIEGTGLGMSIVKKLLALMDTKLEVSSVYGQGSDFSFEVKQKVISWEPIGDFKKKYKEYLASAKKYKEKFTAPEARILVVDDTPMNLTVVKGLLKATKIEVDTAESGFETIDKIKENKYDCIFIDHRMPEMDGIETLEAMKRLEENLNKNVPCIALTANAGSTARDDYKAAGFDDYLSKPVNGETMEEMLCQYLPKEKILFAGETENGDADEETNKAGEIIDEKDKDVLERLKNIDLKEAEKNCGDREVLLNVVKEFYIAIDSKADNIERFEREQDYRNYTVAVHALKSSARLIGAMELSRQAEFLEKCGNEENEAEIKDRTPALLELYRQYKENLAPINEDEEKENLPLIAVDELESAFSGMKELIEAYDFDSAEGIFEMLKSYKIPEQFKEKYDKVRLLIAAVDREGLLEIL